MPGGTAIKAVFGATVSTVKVLVLEIGEVSPQFPRLRIPYENPRSEGLLE